MGGSPNYNYPAQPTYGEGMESAMLSQMQQLLGQGEYADIYKEAGFEGGNLGDILTGVEGPIRKKTAQLDTDIMRQTLLGGEQKVVLDKETGKYGIPGGEIVTSEQMGSDAPTQTAGGRYQMIMVRPENLTAKNWDDRYGNEYAIIDTKTGGMTSLPGADATWGDRGDPSGTNLKNITDKFNELNDSVTAAVKEGVPESEVKLEFEFTNPNIPADSSKAGQPGYDASGRQYLKEGDVVREGTGMIDLMGDTRAVQESVGSEDYESYVRNDYSRMKAFKAENARLAGLGEAPQSVEDWGRAHYEMYGKAAGDKMSTSYTLQDAGRQAGFDEQNKFRGLSALAEDIGRGGQQRAREADIADVERLGGRATEAYRAQGDLSGALAQARGIGAGGAQGLSAIPEDPLFTGAATGTLAERTAAENLGIDAITGGGMTYAKADPAADLTAEISYTPTKGVSGGTYGGALSTYDPNAIHVLGGPGGFPKPTLRSDLLDDAQTSLAGGLTQREERQISEAMKAQSTMMGRTFDQSAGIAEAKARLLEDRNRQALNRQYAQQVLGQEAGLQQSDLGRGLQASLANQQAANQAAQYGVGAGLQREQAGAQLDQQTALANQAAKQEAARYTAQEAMQAQQMELGRQTAGVDRQLTAEEKDIERAMRRGAMEEQYRQQGLGAERASAVQMVGLEQATSADPFQAILKRQGQNNLAAGGVVFGQAGYGLDSGPQYLNPESGLGFIQNQATNAANMFSATTAADATRSAGMWGGIGSALGGGLTGLGSWKCWVAREVYGAHNPAWLLFRNWLDTDAPRWFDKLYLAFGERFANFISNKPRLKARIRLWMDTKIGR